MASPVYKIRGSSAAAPPAAATAASPYSADRAACGSPAMRTRSSIAKAMRKPLEDVTDSFSAGAPAGRIFSSSPSPSPVMGRPSFRSPIPCSSPVFASSASSARAFSPAVMRPIKNSLDDQENYPPEHLKLLVNIPSAKRRLVAPKPVKAAIVLPKPRAPLEPFRSLPSQTIVKIFKFIFPKEFQSEKSGVNIQNFYQHLLETSPVFLKTEADEKEKLCDPSSIAVLSDWLRFDPLPIPNAIARPGRPIIDINCSNMATLNRVSRQFRNAVTAALGKPLERYPLEIRMCRWIIFFKTPETFVVELIFKQIVNQGELRMRLLIEFLIAGYRIRPAQILHLLENNSISKTGFNKNFAEALFCLIYYIWNKKAIVHFSEFLMDFSTYNSAHVQWLLDRIHKEENEAFKQVVLAHLGELRIKGNTILQEVFAHGDYRAIDLMIKLFPKTVQKLLDLDDFRLIKAELARKQACLALLSTVPRIADQDGVLPIGTP